jgi:16S rRNA (cytidine1402-2'-O)-methyltransferase
VLYVVATPIGNLEDVSRRAVNVLADVALIAAEDTRRSLSLLSALGLPRREMVALHDHNETAASSRVRRVLGAGSDVALVSDAGTPLLSDPGFELVRSCFEAVPARRAGRRERLQRLTQMGDPAVFFEAPHRLRECLSDLADIAPTRRVFVAREMTKRFESYECDRPEALMARLDASGAWRGEMVCVLEGAGRVQTAVQAEQMRVMRVLCGELAPAQAARIGAQLLQVRRSDLYDLARQLKGTSD